MIAGPEVPGRRRISLPDFNVKVLRREDLLALEFHVFNLALEAGGGNPPQLVAKDPTQPSFLVAQFDSPQNIAEQAYLEAFTDTPGHQPPPGGNPQTLTEEKPGSSADFPAIAQTRAAGPSRLAFRLPAGTTAVPYSLDGLLNWVALEQSVVPVAEAPDPNQTGVPRAASHQAGSEDPAAGDNRDGHRGALAPVPLRRTTPARGRTSATPVTLTGRTELWHTRLAVRKQQGEGFTVDESIPRRVRAVWSPDYNPGFIPPPPGAAVQHRGGAVPHVARSQ